MKFVAILNNCGFAVNDKNKKLGIQRIPKQTRIFDSFCVFFLKLSSPKIRNIIENNPINCNIDENLYAFIDNPKTNNASPAPDN